jgi:hypothetical protein
MKTRRKSEWLWRLEAVLPPSEKRKNSLKVSWARSPATRLAAALEVSLDYLVGQSDSEIFDKSLLRRLEELVSLPDQDQQGILFALDGLLRDAKTRHAYAASWSPPRRLINNHFSSGPQHQRRKCPAPGLARKPTM